MSAKNSEKKDIDLNQLSDDELLALRICDLPISIEGTWLEGCIADLYREIDAKGLNFKPECYLADEWLTPTEETVVGIPFYLAHPALIRLEKKMMLEAEGETKPWCMRLLRHETGHALTYAYRLNEKKSWQKIFGKSTQEYPDTYHFRPYSKNYVRHLENFYAQYHPDEDFVETFAVWLTPDLNWKEHYQGWKALEKLKFVDRLMEEIKGKPPMVASRQKFWRASHLRTTLKNFYKKKQNFWAEDFPDFHDANLYKMFVPLNPDHDPGQQQITHIQSAEEIIRKYEHQIISSIASWTGEKKYIIGDLLRKIIIRCGNLRLITDRSEPVAILQITSYLTTLIMNYQHTGRFRGKNRRS